MRHAPASISPRLLIAPVMALLAVHGSCNSTRDAAQAAGTGGATGSTTGATTGGVAGGTAGTTGTTGTTTGAGGSGGGASQPPSFLTFPDPTRPWVGAVIVDASAPVTAWHVDGVPLPPPTPNFPDLLLDTRTLSDGPHTLTLAVVQGAAVLTSDTTFHVDNAPSVKPAISGQFVDITQSSGLKLPLVPAGPKSGAVAGDLDGDGKIDVFTWGAVGQAYLQTGPLVFTPTGAPIMGNFKAAGMADLDGDGLPDIVVVGDTVHILHNTGGGTFVDVAPLSGLDALPPRDFRGVTFADVDGDGLIDIAVGQFNCSLPNPAPSILLRNEGGMHFANIAPTLGLEFSTSSVFTLAIDVTDGDDYLHVWPLFENCTTAVTNQFRFEPGDDLPVLVDAVPAVANDYVMGSAFLDATGDGVLDMLVSGLVRAPLWTGPALSQSQAPYVGLDAFPDAMGHALQPWSLVLFDADLDGKPDVLSTHVLQTAMGQNGASGLGLFWQRAPGRFKDIAPDVGLVTQQPCQGAQGVDLDLDGDTDMLLGCHSVLLVLRNDLVDPTPGRTVMLHGSVSNPDGIHAILTTPTGEKRIVRGGGQPFGGGVVRETIRAPSGTLTVQWPSGIVQQVDVGTTPVLSVTEPSVYTVTPRRVDAAAPQPVAVAVDPAALGDAAANVVVTASAGQWTTAVAKDPDGVWRGTLAPPAGAPATVVMSIQVGAMTLKTRPRIFVR